MALRSFKTFGPVKKTENLQFYSSQFKAKTLVSMNKNAFLDIAESTKQGQGEKLS
jgi:hypothetical protein